jgi:hypothetical protein
LGKCIFRLDEEPCELANAWMMPDHKQSFDRTRGLRRNFDEPFGVRAIERTAKFAGRRLVRELAEYQIERGARAQRRGRNGAIRNET